MSHKKILFLALWFLPQVGGMEMSSYEIVKVLRTNGNEVLVVTADHKEAVSFDIEQEFHIRRAKGVVLQKLATKNKIKRIINYLTYYHKYYIEVKKAISNFAPDEIIVADEQTRNWYGFYAKKIPYAPIVVASMPEKKQDKMKIKVVSRTLEVAKNIYCVSHSTKEKMCEAFGNKYEAKMNVLYRSISTNFTEQVFNRDEVKKLRKKYELDGRFTILSVCRLNEKKGLGELLGAIYRLGEKGTNIKLLIAGEGPDKIRLESLINQYSLAEQVYFCGRVSKEDIIHYYDACDLFVLPSREESFGRVYVEAGARHKVSIGCKIGGVLEVIENGESGILVEVNDEVELSEAICKLMENSKFCEKLAENMYARVQKKFSFKASTDAWRKIIQ